jgi:hypothetical protein
MPLASILEILTGLIKILASPGGQDALGRIFNERNISPELIAAEIMGLPSPAPPTTQ